MPLYMDVHRAPGPIDPEDIVKAHNADEAIQDQYGVHFHKYFVSPDNGTVFCLAEGPTKEACVAVHAAAHGLLPDDLIEVDPRLVEAFMGPAKLSPTHNGAAVTNEGQLDSGVRVVVFTEVANLTRASRDIGDEAALEIMGNHDEIVRAALKKHGGREVKHTGEGMMCCFGSASAALRFAQEVQQECLNRRQSVNGYTPKVRVGMSAGEPVANHSELFGSVVTIARRICDAAAPGTVLASAAVHDLAAGKGFKFDNPNVVHVKGVAEPLTLYQLHDDAAAPAARQSELNRYLHELRRRGVIKVGAAYAITFFVLLQVADLTFKPLNLPDWSYKLFLWIGILGFPLALILSWMFDFTREGVERTSSE